MFALLLLMMLVSPNPDYNPDTDKCAGMESGEWHRCQPRVVNLGEWDARPNPYEWPANSFEPAPKPWGEYATEKR